MVVLRINELEKTEKNKVWFSKFQFELRRGEAKAIHCDREIGKQLVEILIGNISASSGEIQYFNESFNGNWKNVSGRIGLILLDDPLYERLNSVDYLNFCKKIYGVETDIHQLLKKVNLANKRYIKISKLSFSEKKRLLLAKSIIHHPYLVIMEEPEQNIDLESKMILCQMIDDLTRQKKAVLVITSNLENAVAMTHLVYRLSENDLKQIDVIDEETRSVMKNESAASVDKSEEQLNFHNQSNQINGNKNKLSEERPSEIKELTNRQYLVERIPAKVNDKIILFDPTEIIYVESVEGVTHLHVKDEVFPCSFTLNELDKRLGPFGFFRCHRSYIVNLQKVREVITWTRNSYSLILDDGKQSAIPLSKGKMSELRSIIGF
ncbi:LytTR family transcriptional regulator DNA-binding domain-containing protein [Bacillus smithii]|uniref:LytTR family transcriptional regulator DNA-binding domain-containing protein n=1 Tax=Bacillus smithii TaxID=1479 RepID=UPI003D2460AD